MIAGVAHYAILAALIFCIGLYGALAKRNAVVILMSIELMLNGAALAMVSFSRFILPQALTGHIFAIFIITVAAAEAAVGLALVLAVFRYRDTIQVDQINLLKW